MASDDITRSPLGGDAPPEGVEGAELPEASDLPAPYRPALPAVAESITTPGARRDDILARYLAEIRRYPLLDPEEERQLAERYRETGDPEAAQRLVTSNLRLVVKLAFQYHRQWSNVLDLIQEGNVGLVEALSRYDPTRGIRFSSYAQYWIRAMILRFLMDNYRLVRLGSTRAGRKLFFQLKKERDRLLQAGLEPTAKRIAEGLGVPESEVIAVDRQLRAPAVRLDGTVGDDPDGRTYQELVEDEDQVSPDEQVARRELQARVQEAMERFAASHLRDDRERVIWEERLVAIDPVPLSALGERFGVSKERIRQVEARIRKRLKAFLQRELGQDIEVALASEG